jgi:hypothetical protein
MSMFIRKRGNAFELRVTHRRLDKPKYATLDAREEAEALGNRTLPRWSAARCPIG